jgi:hypothetical protein
LNGALLRGLFLGAHTKVHNPVCRCAVCSSFTPLEHHGSQVYQKENHQRLLLWEVSVMQQRRAMMHAALWFLVAMAYRFSQLW